MVLRRLWTNLLNVLVGAFISIQIISMPAGYCAGFEGIKDFSLAGFKVRTVNVNSDASQKSEKIEKQVENANTKQNLNTNFKVMNVVKNTEKPKPVNSKLVNKINKYALTSKKSTKPQDKKISTVSQKQPIKSKSRSSGISNNKYSNESNPVLFSDVKSRVFDKPVDDGKPVKEEKPSVSKSASSQSDYELNLPDYPKSKSFADKDLAMPEKSVKEPNMMSLLGSTLFVIALILVIAWFYVRLKGINPASILSGKFSEKNIDQFNLLSTTTLGQGKNIHLVEINGKKLVVGSTNNSINLLTEINGQNIDKIKINNEAEEDDLSFLDPDLYGADVTEIYKEYLNKQKEDTDKY